MIHRSKHIVLTGLFLLLPVQKAAKAQRVPIGIYAVVPVEKVVTPLQNDGLSRKAVNNRLTSLYIGLLNSPAVSGLTLQIHWDTLNPHPPAHANPYSWDYVDDAFSAVQSWNSNNPSAAPKTVQLIVTPGFNSPKWILKELTSCDGLFYSPQVLPEASCGKVTFSYFPEGGDSMELPLPWNTTYQAAWMTFLQALAARYNGNPALVSIAVAGPTAASAEMILPNDGNSGGQPQFMAFGGADIMPSDIWKALLQLQFADHPAYWETDQVFIEAWNQAIDMYGEIFSNITLVATTGNGLPKFPSAIGPFPPATSPIDFTPDCNGAKNMDCQAETAILSHFVQPSVGGNNAKATQTSGLEATRKGKGYLGEYGVRYLSQLTAGGIEVASQILGGAQLNSPLSKGNGAVTDGGSPIFEQALYNMLKDYFTGTNVARLYCAADVETGAHGPAPLNYLQIYYQDIQYAANHGPASISDTCFTGSISAQEELNSASVQLIGIAEP